MLAHVGSFTLGEVNIGLMVGIGLMNPLLVQIDLFLTGQFGLGPFLLDAQVQFNAAISLVTQLGLQISNPFVALQALLTAFAQLQAALALTLSMGLPTVSLQISAQLSAIAALSGALSLKLGGIRAMLAAGVAVKIPALRFVAEMTANLSAGPIQLLSFTGSTLAATGGQIAAQFNAGLGPVDPISPVEPVSGVLILTKDPAVFVALSAILKTS